MAKSIINWTGIILLAIGAGMLYYDKIYDVCTGLNNLNPFCLMSAATQHLILFWGGIILVIIGIIKIAKS